ncbi:elongin BC and Polycomb repressive complex 2-associated protein-like [Strigops habroptila]|uniref:elongin BC and Polycomb repressive complex 2-associated protein-like n=1 Tax=Strigops habroptila TaxID=2489341 RepID=UPI0011D028B5|nr:elongin BC and Polycomb repressive complex 2-associated protein-like [Strigops habroptila]XP_030368099.1 elongin BC and Polycomb repressive complex 2-associated protein-like [Strigops habroptila]
MPGSCGGVRTRDNRQHQHCNRYRHGHREPADLPQVKSPALPGPRSRLRASLYAADRKHWARAAAARRSAAGEEPFPRHDTLPLGLEKGKEMWGAGGGRKGRAPCGRQRRLGSALVYVRATPRQAARACGPPAGLRPEPRPGAQRAPRRPWAARPGAKDGGATGWAPPAAPRPPSASGRSLPAPANPGASAEQETTLRAINTF